MKAKNKVKITVLKRLSTEDVYGEDFPFQLTEDYPHVCPRLKDGQEFLVLEDGACPDGFCGWAFADLHRDITHLRYGGKYFYKDEGDKGVQISCCTDGVRPVFFKLEGIK